MKYNLVKETPKAVRLELDGYGKLWFPKKLIEFADDEVQIPDWLLEQQSEAKEIWIEEQRNRKNVRNAGMNMKQLVKKCS